MDESQYILLVLTFNFNFKDPSWTPSYGLHSNGIFHTPAAETIANLLVHIDQISASMASWMAISAGKYF